MNKETYYQKYGKKYYRKNSSVIKKRTADWYKNNIEKVKQHRINKYGLTIEQVNAMLLLQNNACAICKIEFFGGVRKVIDHNHKTNKVRAILCSYCNTSLGMVRESVETLENMIKYLKDWGG